MAGWKRKKGHEQEHHFVLSRRLLLKMLASCTIVTLLPLLLCNLMHHNEIRKNHCSGEKERCAVSV